MMPGGQDDEFTPVEQARMAQGDLAPMYTKVITQVQRAGWEAMALALGYDMTEIQLEVGAELRRFKAIYDAAYAQGVGACSTFVSHSLRPTLEGLQTFAQTYATIDLRGIVPAKNSPLSSGVPPRCTNCGRAGCLNLNAQLGRLECSFCGHRMDLAALTPEQIALKCGFCARVGTVEISPKTGRMSCSACGSYMSMAQKGEGT